MAIDKDWEAFCLESELEFSKALLSQPTVYPDFIHLWNPYVPWGGDFNRAVGVRWRGQASFKRIAAQVAQIHQERGLDPPDRFDVNPPVLDEGQWEAILSRQGFRLRTAIFFNAPAEPFELPDGYALYSPNSQEFFNWYTRQAVQAGYASEDWFEQHLPLKANFIKVFKPYWLFREQEQVGWVYAARLGEYCRLFEVEITHPYRGQGMGRLLVQAIRAEGFAQGVEFILLQSNQALCSFYEKCGFRQCSVNSIIRLAPG